MADLDNTTVPFKANITAVKLISGDGTPKEVTLALLQGSTITWSESGRTVVEARDRGRHQSTPVLEETDDGNVTGSLVLYVTSWKGNANTHPYEVMSKTGNASAWSPVGGGGAHTVKMEVTMDSSVDGGDSQTGTFAVVHFESIEVGEQEKLNIITASFTDYENRPTWA